VRRQVRGKVAAVLAAQEVLGQLSLEVVDEAPAVVGDEAPGLLLDAALTRALDGRKNAPKNAAWERAGALPGTDPGGRRGFMAWTAKPGGSVRSAKPQRKSALTSLSTRGRTYFLNRLLAV
jgi:hypothetical protein